MKQCKLDIPNTGVFAIIREDGVASMWVEGKLHNAFVEYFVVDEKQYCVKMDNKGITIEHEDASVEYYYKQEFNYKQEPMFTYFKHSWRNIVLN